MGKKSNETTIEDICRWIVKKLKSDGSVSPKDLKTEFGSEKSVQSLLSRARQAVSAVLAEEGSPIELEPKTKTLSLAKKDGPHDSELGPYDTPNYPLNEERDAKEKIGTLIAGFLSDKLLQKKTIFLGSGTTIFHVARQMCRQKIPYGQRFVTANIPLAAMFCNPKGIQPVSKITIPEAVLETRTSRFSTMPGLNYPITVSIVAADGCVFNEDTKKVEFYGNEDAVAANTNLFVQNTRHTVLFCLTYKKIQVGFATNPNTGPPIHPPKNKSVIRVLVSNQPYDQAVKALEADGWLIVTDEGGWEPVLKKMASGETPKDAQADLVVGSASGGADKNGTTGATDVRPASPRPVSPPVPERPSRIVRSRKRPKQLAGTRAAGASGSAPGKRPATNAESVEDPAKE